MNSAFTPSAPMGHPQPVATGANVPNDSSRIIADPGSWILRSISSLTSSALEAVVTKFPFRIGRTYENDLSIPNETVSSCHAELFLCSDGLCLIDVGSTNGTFVNGRRIEGVHVLQDGDSLQFGTARFSIRQEQETHVTNRTATVDAAGDAIAHLQFEELLRLRAVTPFFQPVVRLEDSSRIGFEVLARSKLMGLQQPSAMFRVAEERGLETELSAMMRSEGLRTGSVLGPGTQFYLNTHPSELKENTLFESLEKLRNEAPDTTIILEIHEAAVTSSKFLKQLSRRLSDFNIGLAYDDFGAGQARLLELVEVPPDVIKFDICLVQGLGEAPCGRHAMVQALVRAVRDLGVTPLAEGVETAADAAACRDLGFELAQGYFFGHPAPAAEWIKPPHPHREPQNPS